MASVSLRFNVRISSKRLLTSRMIAAMPFIAPNSFFIGTMVNVLSACDYYCRYTGWGRNAMSFEYVSVEEAIKRHGLRMVVVGDVPSLWG